MDRRSCYIVILLLILGMSLVLSGCQSAGPQPEETAGPTETTKPEETSEPEVQIGTTYKVGFAPDVTGGGALLGEAERNVAEIIAAQLEKEGGIVGPDGVRQPVEILIGDTEINPDVAVSVARRYIDEDEVTAIIAGSVTPISLAIAEVAEEAEVPYISMDTREPRTEMATQRSTVTRDQHVRTTLDRCRQDRYVGAIAQADRFRSRERRSTRFRHEHHSMQGGIERA